jgi:hypothetical protein
LSNVDKDDEFVAKLSVALFESELESEAEVLRSGYNSAIVKHAILQMLTLKKESPERFSAEAEKRLTKFGLHFSEFLE